MRLFIGIPVKPEIQRLLREWREQHMDLGDIRWTKESNLHMTLVAPWNVIDPEEAISIFDNFVYDKPFAIQFQTIGYGPMKQTPRMIWATAPTVPEMRELHKDLYAAFGRDLPSWPFTPHITLARFRPEDFASFPEKKFLDIVDWEMQVDEIALFASRLLRTGAEYQVIKRKTLRL